MLVVVVTALVAPVLALVAHEAGHACAAVALGARGVRVRRIPWGAAVEATLASDGRRAAFLLAGPLASATAGGALLAVGGAAAVVGAVSLALAALTLAGSDGRQALALVRLRARALARPCAKSNHSRGRSP